MTIARDPDDLEGARCARRPGRRCGRRRRWTGSAAAGLVDRSATGSRPGGPYLGICLGLQLLFDGSDEDGAVTLGVVAGRTERLVDAPTLPHIGWNQVERVREHPAFAGIAPDADFYFVHSYAGSPAGPDAGGSILARTTHGAILRERDRPRQPPRRPVPPRAERDGRSAAARQRRRLRWPPAGSNEPGGSRFRLMLRRRVIPCLDVRDGRVVKGTRFVDLVDEGDPAALAERYATEGADELVFLDISAAPEGRGTLLDIVERTARRAFIPLTVGGGVRSVEEMRAVLRAGADKVGLNTAAVADPALVAACAARFGRQAVVVAIDARRRTAGEGWEVVVKGGREATGLDAVDVGGRRRRAGGRRAARDLDRPRRHALRIRHRAPPGDHLAGRGAR